MIRTLTVIIALVLGATFAESYARLATPFYSAVAQLLAGGHPWTIAMVNVQPDDASPGVVLRLVAQVRRHAGEPLPAAIAIARIHVGETIEGPLVFWTLLILWPAANWRMRLFRLATGLPVFLGLEAATTGVQLVHDLPGVSAILAGEPEPFTWWEEWSRFLEAGGTVAMAVFGALLSVVIARWGTAVTDAGN